MNIALLLSFAPVLPAVFVFARLFTPQTISKAFRSIFRPLLAPFRQFLDYEDLVEIKDGGALLETPINRNLPKALVALSFTSALLSAIALSLQLAVFDSWKVPATLGIINASSSLLASVISLADLIWHPPRAVPYMQMFLHGCLHTSATALSMAFGLWKTFPREFEALYLISMLVISSIFIIVSGYFPLRSLMPVPNVAPTSHKLEPSSKYSNPEDGTYLWAWCTFSFIKPIIHLASRRTIDPDDAWSLSPFFRHRSLFEKQLEYRKNHPKHSLLRFLLAASSLDLIIVMTVDMYHVIAGFIPPYALNRLLAIIASPDKTTHSAAYIYAFLTLAAHLSFAQCDLFVNFHSRRAYERTRGQLFCAIHYKALRRLDLSGHGRNDETGKEAADLGKVVNIMQGDSYSVAQRFWEFSVLFTAPVRLTLALVFLHRVLGPSALLGVLVFMLSYASTYHLVQWNIRITRAMWAAKDARLNSVSELFQNIRFLKFYGWESLWSAKVIEKRDEELRWKVKENIVNTIIGFIWQWIPSAVALTSFLSYTLIFKQPMTVSQVFTTISLFEQLKEPMKILPDSIFALLHAYVSMQRIEGYMKEDEVPDWACSLSRDDAHSNGATTNGHSSYAPLPPKIGFEDAVISWHTATGPQAFRLRLNVNFPQGLNLIIGHTGSGKSALLSALLGELRLEEGAIHLPKAKHKTAYSAQHAFLEHATIRENIIFGSTLGFDSVRYRKTIDACALGPDLATFAAGDRTEIGDRGVTLSGGQKARIALARAVYSQASYVLLDDPLAAVDTHTAQHIFEKCLSGELMRGRTVILVTHHFSLCLPAAIQVIELSHGQVLKQGPPSAFTDKEYSYSDSEQDEKTPPEEEEASQLVSGALGEAEARAEGRVSLKTYLLYVRSAGAIIFTFTFILILLIRGVSLLEQLFLAKWGEAYEKRPSSSIQMLNSLPSWSDLPPPADNVVPWILLYTSISLASAFTVLAYIATGYYASIKASRKLFEAMFRRLIRAPVRFFDTTPFGRILNRFTTDMSTIDGSIQNSARAAIAGSVTFLASFAVILVLIPAFAPLALTIAMVYIVMAPNYIRACRDLRRLESLALSPAFAGFDELLRGLGHIRAYAMELRYHLAFYKKVDAFQNFDHIYWQVCGWLKWRYDVLGSIIVFCTTCFALWRELSDGLAALVIIQAGIFAEASRQLVKVGAQLELDFNSVERVSEYLDLPQEAPAVADHRPPAYWPSSSGQVAIEGLVVRYSVDGPDALKGVSLSFSPSEKIGVVGRTGSGKSTLAMSFLRIVEAFQGRIIIDGIDINTIGLDDLRGAVTIVSQDVALFSGTVRDNIDPAGLYTDKECWDILKRCHLVSEEGEVRKGPITDLYSHVSPQGTFSAGERQLVALARAIIRRSRVVILDEATSHMSHELDHHIQTVIKEELAEATVITIAHRLRTTFGLDRIVVLQEGVVVEFDTPRKLLEKDGIYAKLCKNSPDWPFDGI